MDETVIKLVICIWGIGFMASLPRAANIAKLQIQVPKWIQLLLFIIIREKVDFLGLIWQGSLYIMSLVLFILSKINLNLDIGRYYAILIFTLLGITFIDMIIELYIYKKK